MEIDLRPDSERSLDVRSAWLPCTHTTDHSDVKAHPLYGRVRVLVI
jgi:hypothetical protein